MTAKTEAALSAASANLKAARAAFARSKSAANRAAYTAAVEVYDAALEYHLASPTRAKVRRLRLLGECLSIYFPARRAQFAFGFRHDFSRFGGTIARR